MYKRQTLIKFLNGPRYYRYYPTKSINPNFKKCELKQPVQAVPKTIQEGPQNTWQLCYLYRVTFDKLQSSPSMYRAVHLKNTMETLQERRRMEQEEDNLPLAFIEKRPSPQLTLSNKHLVQA